MAKFNRVREGAFVVMDGVCWQVACVIGEVPLGDCKLVRLAGGTAADANESLVPTQMLDRLVALGEAVLARNVDAV